MLDNHAKWMPNKTAISPLIELQNKNIVRVGNSLSSAIGQRNLGRSNNPLWLADALSQL